MSNPKALTTDSIIAKNYSFALKDGFVIDGEPGFTLMPYDEVYVRKSPAYSKQQSVTVDGEVMFAGTYTLSKRNMRLTDLLKAAGGITDMAYVKGADWSADPTRLNAPAWRLPSRYNKSSCSSSSLNWLPVATTAEACSRWRSSRTARS